MATRAKDFDTLWDQTPEQRMTGGPDFVRTGPTFDELWDGAGPATEPARPALPSAESLTIRGDATRAVERETDQQRAERIRRSANLGAQFSSELGLPVTRGPVGRPPVSPDLASDATAVALPERRPTPSIRAETPHDVTLGSIAAAQERDQRTLQERFDKLTPGPVGPALSAARGVANATTLGHASELVNAVNHGLGLVGDDALTVDEVMQDIDRTALEHIAEVGGFVGGAAGAIRLSNQMLARLAPAAREGSRLRTVLSSFDPATEASAGTRALQGAVEGLPFDLAYEADTPGERLRNVTLGVGLGGTLGPVLGGRVRRAPDVEPPARVRADVPPQADEISARVEGAQEEARRAPESVTTVTPAATPQVTPEPAPAPTTFDQAWDAAARMAPAVEPDLQPTRIAPADPLRARYRAEYRNLSDDELEDRWRQLQRGAGRTQLDADASFQRDAVRGFNTWGDVVAGTRSSTSGMHARGRNTQQQARIRAVEAELRSRGRDIPTSDPYADVGRGDVLEPNKDLVGMGGRALRALSDPDLESEIEASLARWLRDQGDTSATERLAILYAEAQREGRNIDFEVFAGRRGAMAEMAEDLFGRPSDAAEQGDLLPTRPQGRTEALNQARATVSTLEGKVTRGQATKDELHRYLEARSFTRRSQGLDAEEVRGRISTGAEPEGERPGDLFDSLWPAEAEADDIFRGAERRALTGIDRQAQQRAKSLGRRATDDPLAEARRMIAQSDVDPDVILGEKVQSLSGLRRDEGKFRLGRAGEAEPLPNKAQIVRDLSDALGVPVRTGRFKGQARGIFKIRPEVIRSRIAGDIENVAHEAGHHLHKVLFGTTKRGLANRPLMPWADELRPLAQGVSDESLAEGYAEFVRRYVTNEDAARSAAPRFFGFFEGKLSEALPEALTALKQARSDYRAYLEAPARARVRAQRARPEDLKPALAGSERWRAIRTKVIDDLTPLRTVAKAGGVTEADILEDIGTLADLARGSAGQAEWMVNQGMLRFGTKTSQGRPLKAVFDPIRDASGKIDPERYEDLMDYLVARRVRYLYDTRESEIGFLGIERADAEQVIRELDSPEFREVLTRFGEFNDGMLTYLRDAGVLSKEAVRAIQSRNEVYVPLMRVMDQERAASAGGRSKASGINPVKRIKGSGRQIIDPAEVMLERTYQYTRLAAKQQVANALYALSKRDGMGHLIEQLPTPTRVFKAPVREVLQKLFQDTDAGADFIDTLPDEALEELLMFHRPGDYAGAQDVISVIVEGKRRFFQVDPELYRALEGLDDQVLPTWAKIMGAPARTLRAGATLAPEFIARNPVRDQLMAAVQSEWGYTPFVDLVRGVSSILKRDEFYEAFMAGGGARSSLVGLDRATIRKNLRAAIGLEGVVKNPLDALRALSEVMEDATRVAETRNALTALRAQGVPEGAARLRAASAARGISVDFARRGTDTAVFRYLTAFWNARLQGYDRLAQAFKRDPQGTTAKAVAYITVPSVLEYMVNRNDPEYFEIPRWQRDLFWVFKVNGSWIRIPKPFELGVVFGTLPQRAMEWMDRNDPEGFDVAAREFLKDQAVGMLPIPTAALPIMEGWANRSQFLQRPLVPMGLEAVDPAEQFTRSSSELSVGLGRMLNMSPLKIDNALFAYTGGLGRIAAEVADIALPFEDQIGERRPGSFLRLPGIRGFTVAPPGEQSESVERLYQARERANARRSTYQKLLREGRTEEADVYFARNEDWIVRAAQLNRIADQLTDIRTALRNANTEEERQRLATLLTNVAAQALGRGGLQEGAR